MAQWVNLLAARPEDLSSIPHDRRRKQTLTGSDSTEVP